MRTTLFFFFLLCLPNTPLLAQEAATIVDLLKNELKAVVFEAELQESDHDFFIKDIGKTKLDLTGPMSIQAWIYPTAYSGVDACIIVNKESCFEMSLFGPEGRFCTAFQIAGATEGSWNWQGTAKIPLNRFTHLTVTFDGNTVVQYVDGIEVYQYPLVGKINENDQDLRIGARGGDQTPSEFFSGRIFLGCLYDRALSAQEIRRQFKLQDEVLAWMLVKKMVEKKGQ